MKLRTLYSLLVCVSFVAFGCASAPALKPVAPPPSAAVGDIHLPMALTLQMRSIGTQLTRLGMHADPRAFAGFLPSGNHATYALHIPSNTCATLVAFATTNAHDVDAALYTPEGELLAVDSEPDPHPTIQVCTDREADLYYVLQLYDGDGSFVMLPFYSQRNLLGPAAHVLGGRPALVEAVSAREIGDNPITSLSEGLRKRGFSQVGDADGLDIAEHETVRTALPAQAGECYTVAAFGESSVHALSMRVLDSSGKTLATSDDESQSHAELQLCARESASYSVETEAREGAGRITFLTFHIDVASAGGEQGLWLGQQNVDAKHVAQ